MDTLLMFGSGFIAGFAFAVLLYRIYRRQSKTDDVHRMPTVLPQDPVHDGLAIVDQIVRVHEEPERRAPPFSRERTLPSADHKPLNVIPLRRR